MEENQRAHVREEVVITVTERHIEEECEPKLTFGTDGAINDPGLLRLIRQTEPLGPIDVLKLAQFFSNVPINILLVEAMWATALSKMLTHPRFQEDARSIFHLDSKEFADGKEDSKVLDPGRPFLGSTDDEPPKEDPNDQVLFFVGADIMPVANASTATKDVGLVIQSLEDGENIRYFVIGVSPSPASLPLEGLKRGRGRKPHPKRHES